MKKFAFQQGQFLISAYTRDQFPTLKNSHGDPMPEAAFVGRSNVGKSSLINSLFKGQKLAKASSTPGKTQSINFFIVDQQLCLVDLPGYGYAKVSKELKEKWSELIDDYLNTRTQLRLILFLIDSRREISEQDVIFLQWAAHRKIPLLLVFTKADKIKPVERERHASQCINYLQSLNLKPACLLYYSIKNPRARIELVQLINHYFS